MGKRSGLGKEDASSIRGEVIVEGRCNFTHRGKIIVGRRLKFIEGKKDCANS
jgi:hypothetical protein